MSWKITALKVSLVWLPMAVAFNDLVMGVVPVTGDTYGIKDKEMSSNMKDKSWLIVNKWMGTRLRRGELEKDDLVVLIDPTDPQKRIVRKIEALNDTWVRVDDGVESYHVYVRKGYCWLDGRQTKIEKEKSEEEEQNIDQALELIKSKHDSMTFGPVSMGLIIGSPLFVLNPLSRFGAIRSIPPSTASGVETGR